MRTALPCVPALALLLVFPVADRVLAAAQPTSAADVIAPAEYPAYDGECAKDDSCRLRGGLNLPDDAEDDWLRTDMLVSLLQHRPTRSAKQQSLSTAKVSLLESKRAALQLELREVNAELANTTAGQADRFRVKQASAHDGERSEETGALFATAGENAANGAPGSAAAVDDAPSSSHHASALQTAVVFPESAQELSSETNRTPPLRSSAALPTLERLAGLQQAGAELIATIASSVRAEKRSGNMSVELQLTLGLIVLLAAVMTTVCCSLNYYFSGMNSLAVRRSLGLAPASGQDSLTGMRPGHWMIVYSYGPGAIKYASYSGESQARADFQDFNPVITRILFDQHHVEAAVHGLNTFVLDRLRTASRKDSGRMLPGKWMVVVGRGMFGSDKMHYFAFDLRYDAEHFANTFQADPVIIYKPVGQSHKSFREADGCAWDCRSPSNMRWEVETNEM